MGNAGRNGGEYYTPRPLIRAMIQVVKPRIGERIYDGACGSAGFLCESFEYLTKDRGKLSTKDMKTLQEKTFYGKEKKPLAYVLGVMNMILHGIEAPNLVRLNTLEQNISDIQDKDRFDVVLANPPFGGKERKEIQHNFPIRTGETAFLFLQHFIKSLKAGGRGGIVIKNTFLSNTDNASLALRKELLENCNLHTVLDMPGGTFQGAGVKTVVLFFEKGAPTRKIWFYKLDPGRNLGKTNPLNDEDLKDFVALQATFKNSENSWMVDAKSIDKERTIQHMMATSYWSPDGKPISANQMVEKLYGELPRFFKDEDELRRLWSKPDTRKVLLQSLAEKGFGAEQLSEISRMINAEKSDVFDVLAYISFALAPITRSERVGARKSKILGKYDPKLQAFLDFVLAQYVNQGVSELDQDKLADLLQLKYHSVPDAADQLGGIPAIRDTFVGFQRYLYE
jgi:type I restriction-modification system DNA methylase subunit